MTALLRCPMCLPPRAIREIGVLPDVAARTKILVTAHCDCGCQYEHEFNFEPGATLDALKLDFDVELLQEDPSILRVSTMLPDGSPFAYEFDFDGDDVYCRRLTPGEPTM